MGRTCHAKGRYLRFRKAKTMASIFQMLMLLRVFRKVGMVRAIAVAGESRLGW